jgi:hypothetical protein
MTRNRVSLLFLLVGVVALAIFIWKLGWAPIVDALVSFAPAFPVILLIEFLSNVGSTTGWYYAFSPADRPTWIRLQAVNFASLPLSGALPTGQAGEVLKANLLRGRVVGGDIVSSLVVYNALHVATTALIMAVGPAVALASGAFGAEVSGVLLVVSLGIAGSMLGLGVMLRWGLFARVTRLLGRLPWKALKSTDLEARAADVDRRFRAMWHDRRRDLLLATTWLLAARVIQIAEVWLILGYLMPDATWLTAWMAFTGTALANYVLLVLPAREGFLEGSAYVVFEALGLSGAHGFTLELTRRLRKIVFQVGGLVLLLVLSREKEPTSPLR